MLKYAFGIKSFRKKLIYILPGILLSLYGVSGLQWANYVMHPNIYL